MGRRAEQARSGRIGLGRWLGFLWALVSSVRGTGAGRWAWGASGPGAGRRAGGVAALPLLRPLSRACLCPGVCSLGGTLTTRSSLHHVLPNAVTRTGTQLGPSTSLGDTTQPFAYAHVLGEAESLPGPRKTKAACCPCLSVAAGAQLCHTGSESGPRFPGASLGTRPFIPGAGERTSVPQSVPAAATVLQGRGHSREWDGARPRTRGTWQPDDGPRGTWACVPVRRRQAPP